MRRGCNDCTVGPGFLCRITRFDSPDDATQNGIVWRRLRQSRRFSTCPAALL